MNTVNRRQVIGAHMSGYSLVAGQHELFYHHIGHAPFMHAHIYGFALFVQCKFRLRSIKIYASGRPSPFAENAGQLLHKNKLAVYM